MRGRTRPRLIGVRLSEAEYETLRRLGRAAAVSPGVMAGHILRDHVERHMTSVAGASSGWDQLELGVETGDAAPRVNGGSSRSD